MTVTATKTIDSHLFFPLLLHPAFKPRTTQNCESVCEHPERSRETFFPIHFTHGIQQRKPISRSPRRSNLVVGWGWPHHLSGYFAGFTIDKNWFDVIMPAYNKRLGGDNLKWRSINEFFRKSKHNTIKVCRLCGFTMSTRFGRRKL